MRAYMSAPKAILKLMYVHSYITRWNTSDIKVGVACVGIYISRVTEKQLWVNTCNVIYNSYTTKELKNKAVLNQYCMHYYVVLSNVLDSNYSKQGFVAIY